MCGIGAFISYKPTKLHRKFVQVMLANLMTRGRDAAGFATYRDDGQVIYRKRPGPASYLAAHVMNMPSRLFKGARISIVHDRAATHGSTLNNENNHPLWATTPDDKLVTLVHNGIIYSKRLEKWRDVDSDYLLAGIRKYGLSYNAIKWTLERLTGSHAVIVTDGKDVYFWRRSNPLWMTWTDAGIILASEKWQAKETAKELKLKIDRVEEVKPDRIFKLGKSGALYELGAWGYELKSKKKVGRYYYYYPTLEDYDDYYYHGYSYSYGRYKEKDALRTVWTGHVPRVGETVKTLLGDFAELAELARLIDEGDLASAIALARAAGVLVHHPGSKELCFEGIDQMLCAEYTVEREDSSLVLKWDGMSVEFPATIDVWERLLELDNERRYILFPSKGSAFKQVLNDLKAEVREFPLKEILG